jgi:hypothetical protein
MQKEIIRMNKICMGFLVLIVSGCAAKQTLPGAEKVMLSNEKPTEACEFIGEIIGGQGNWWTDDITSSVNIVKGSRNDLRNEAHQLGANFVHIQQASGSENYLGGSTMAIVGNAYKCAS